MLKLKVGLKGLEYLISKWDDETTQCNYAELSRDLLSSKNKAELLDAAKTNALFDKDNKYMIVKCKRNPTVIRSFLGLASSEDPLHRAPSNIAKFRKFVNPDRLDAYIEAEENFARLIASADAMAYGSSFGDFSANNEFKKGERPDKKTEQFLMNAKNDIEQARSALAVIVESLEI
ncbi:hypothetical protein GUITHDRAFT_131661 [Guillardia theta CCMP2712]|uniref:Uncharacterized protein n=1 Tax=Guillardia theta (strain CCMP2712) TaxID=905079 RepID=L1K4F5_GUITC|nr:hypothetical protein GUITHDRAFT_131661 [Guillardia theta CCMP2712]EKX55467.1 hypothetical protein GUITHDRAFT_131661 [Guillardia theta CCMP2712]|eukprot:XP_005842447.1 hypothetical protein GUITHDRAFT_131661 [Guillardia theta CCMP2712]